MCISWNSQQQQQQRCSHNTFDCFVALKSSFNRNICKSETLYLQKIVCIIIIHSFVHLFSHEYIHSFQTDHLHICTFWWWRWWCYGWRSIYVGLINLSIPTKEPKPPNHRPLPCLTITQNTQTHEQISMYLYVWYFQAYQCFFLLNSVLYKYTNYSMRSLFSISICVRFSFRVRFKSPSISLLIQKPPAIPKLTHKEAFAMNLTFWVESLISHTPRPSLLHPFESKFLSYCSNFVHSTW